MSVLTSFRGSIFRFSHTKSGPPLDLSVLPVLIDLTMARDLLRDEGNLGSHIFPRGKVLRGIEPDPKFEITKSELISANRPHVSMLGLNREGAHHTFHQICMESTSGGLAEMSSLFELKLGSIG